MIDWNKTTDTDLVLIRKCAKRAYKELKNIVPISFMDLEMDITAANIASPLKLEELLNADDFNFAHDICGIRANINRDSGEMNNCFLPRFTA